MTEQRYLPPAELEAELRKIRDQQRELREAIRAGEEVLVRLDGVIKLLDSASKWGWWDVLGGGFFVTMAKYNRLDKAKVQALKAQEACHVFARELRDVKFNLKLNIDFDGFLRFADYFFDGLFSDIATQSRISSMRNDVRRQRSEVEGIIGMLRWRLAQAEAEAQKLSP
ncbi:MAG: hypothetical protein GX060_05790 [Firmicutes bacterium]|nr:hypothetical protein [Bacillota bacterium]